MARRLSPTAATTLNAAVVTHMSRLGDALRLDIHNYRSRLSAVDRVDAFGRPAVICWLPVVRLQMRMRDIRRKPLKTTCPFHQLWRYVMWWVAMGVAALLAFWSSSG